MNLQTAALLSGQGAAAIHFMMTAWCGCITTVIKNDSTVLNATSALTASPGHPRAFTDAGINVQMAVANVVITIYGLP